MVMQRGVGTRFRPTPRFGTRWQIPLTVEDMDALKEIKDKRRQKRIVDALRYVIQCEARTPSIGSAADKIAESSRLVAKGYGVLAQKTDQPRGGAAPTKRWTCYLHPDDRAALAAIRLRRSFANDSETARYALRVQRNQVRPASQPEKE